MILSMAQGGRASPCRQQLAWLESAASVIQVIMIEGATPPPPGEPRLPELRAGHVRLLIECGAPLRRTPTHVPVPDLRNAGHQITAEAAYNGRLLVKMRPRWIISGASKVLLRGCVR